MKFLINRINEICGTNGCTTYAEIAKASNVSYNKVKYFVGKFTKQGLLGVIYPGLGGIRQNYIYNKCCIINNH